MNKARSYLLLAAALLAITCLATTVQAASVGLAGYTNDFSTLPPAADWSYFNIAGGNADIGSTAQMDATIEAIAASSINNQLTTDSTINPPAASAFGTWSALGFFIQTRPTGNAASVIMCTLVNNLGGDASSVTLSYDFTKAAVLAEEVDGHRAYYSLSGAAGSWVALPEFSSGAPGRLSATLNFSWAAGGALYIIWADDNAVAASPDTAMQIDNFSATAIPAAQVAAAITSQPQSQTVGELQPASFAVGVSGNHIG